MSKYQSGSTLPKIDGNGPKSPRRRLFCGSFGGAVLSGVLPNWPRAAASASTDLEQLFPTKLNCRPPFETFWRYDATQLTKFDRKVFNTWHANSHLKSITPKIDGAFFRMSYPRQEISINTAGDLTMVRSPQDRDPHTMLEISVNNQKGVGHFVNYGGYRSMAIGVPYEFELDVLIEPGEWLVTIPWLVVFQGHAIPDALDTGKKFNPPFALIVRRGRWRADVRADARLSLPRDRSYQRNHYTDLGPIVPGSWTRFVIRVVWGYEDAPQKPAGSLAIWRDGTLYLREIGRMNFYNNVSYLGESVGPYCHIGAYCKLGAIKDEQATVRFRRFVIRSEGKSGRALFDGRVNREETIGACRDF